MLAKWEDEKSVEDSLWNKNKRYRITYFIGRAGVHMAAGLLFFVMLAIVVNSADRYIFGGGIHLIIESAKFVMLFVVFLGLAGTHLVSGHVSVDLLLSHLSDRTNEILRRYFVPAATLIYLCFIFYSGWVVTWRLFADGVVSTGVIPIPLGPMLAVMPFGCLLMIVVLVAECKVYFTRGSLNISTYNSEVTNGKE
jgi:TRAP-type C4-dicarboxylate transport system permease small subunit